jgi:hypothetical protein
MLTAFLVSLAFKTKLRGGFEVAVVLVLDHRSPIGLRGVAPDEFGGDRQ